MLRAGTRTLQKLRPKQTVYCKPQGTKCCTRPHPGQRWSLWNKEPSAEQLTKTNGTNPSNRKATAKVQKKHKTQTPSQETLTSLNSTAVLLWAMITLNYNLRKTEFESCRQLKSTEAKPLQWIICCQALACCFVTAGKPHGADTSQAARLQQAKGLLREGSMLCLVSSALPAKALHMQNLANKWPNTLPLQMPLYKRYDSVCW